MNSQQIRVPASRHSREHEQRRGDNRKNPRRGACRFVVIPILANLFLERRRESYQPGHSSCVREKKNHAALDTWRTNSRDVAALHPGEKYPWRALSLYVCGRDVRIGFSKRSCWVFLPEYWEFIPRGGLDEPRQQQS